jgi:hypothetical protein
MKIRLTIENWIQLLSPQVLAIIFLFFATKESENILVLFIKIIYHLIDFFLPLGAKFNYFRCLAASNIIVILLMLAPFMSYDRKTGRRFKTKYGMIDEYETVTANMKIDITYYFEIMLIHIILVVVYFYTADKSDSSISYEKNNNTEESIKNRSDYSFDNKIDEYDNSENEISNEYYNEDKFNREREQAEQASNLLYYNELNLETLEIYNNKYLVEYSEAESICLTKNMRIPSYDEIIKISNDSESFKQLNPNLKSEGFWTSTEYKDDEDYLYSETLQKENNGMTIKYMKTYNPFSEKTTKTDIRVNKNCICIN